MAIPTVHPCAVCFEPASSRCSSCHQDGVELWFCSPACQRLVWPVHKPVCGPQTEACDPIRHPTLSREEAALAKADLHYNGLGEEGLRINEIRGTGVTLMHAFLRSGVSEHQVDHVLAALVAGREQWRLPRTVICSSFQMLKTVRYYRCQNHTGRRFYEPYPVLADFEAALNTASDMQINLTKDWHAGLVHRALIFFAAVEKKRSELREDEAFDRWLEQAYKRWRASLAGYMAGVAPQWTQAVLKATQSSYDVITGTWEPK
ncbi:hypothetical protein JCM10213_003088 [Rhodosporidiobolus nylandii]